MIKINDALLDKMLEAGGGIKPAYRLQIAECLKARYEREGDEHMRATPQTRKLVRKTLAYFAKGLEGLTQLEANPEFRRYNLTATPGKVEEQLGQLSDHQAHAASSVDWLLAEKKRLGRRSIKGVEDYLRSCFFTELLEIRTESLGIDVPSQASETTTSGPFLEYLELGVRITEPHLKESELKGALKRALTITVKGFTARRTKLDYCWQWEDLFPKTCPTLFYKAFPDESPPVIPLRRKRNR